MDLCRRCTREGGLDNTARGFDVGFDVCFSVLVVAECGLEHGYFVELACSFLQNIWGVGTGYFGMMNGAEQEGDHQASSVIYVDTPQVFFLHWPEALHSSVRSNAR